MRIRLRNLDEDHHWKLALANIYTACTTGRGKTYSRAPHPQYDQTAMSSQWSPYPLLYELDTMGITHRQGPDSTGHGNIEVVYGAPIPQAPARALPRS
ncbi:hypothetical protein TWF281_002330 [Arthrobotrys megalospora]